MRLPSLRAGSVAPIWRSSATSSAMNQASEILPSIKLEDADLVDVDGLAGRRDAEQVALVGARDLEQVADHVALGDDLHPGIDAVREGAAQKVAGAWKTLSGRIGGEVQHAAAVAPVVGRHEFRFDLLHGFAELLRLLEAAHDRLVALVL